VVEVVVEMVVVCRDDGADDAGIIWHSGCSGNERESLAECTPTHIRRGRNRCRCGEPTSLSAS
jgi:hypothetical protein